MQPLSPDWQIIWSLVVVVWAPVILAHCWFWYEDIRDWRQAIGAAEEYLDYLIDEIVIRWPFYDGPASTLRDEMAVFDDRLEIIERQQKWAVIPYAESILEEIKWQGGRPERLELEVAT